MITEHKVENSTLDHSELYKHLEEELGSGHINLINKMNEQGQENILKIFNTVLAGMDTEGVKHEIQNNINTINELGSIMNQLKDEKITGLIKSGLDDIKHNPNLINQALKNLSGLLKNKNK